MILQQRRIPESHRAGGLAHVLVIVDSPELRTQLVTAISAVTGVETAVAESAHKAISLVQRRLPDVIVADVAMDDLDGFRLCKLLKLPLTSGSDQIPVILISNSYRDVLAEHVARKAQAYAYLKLPGDEEIVARTVELALHRLLPSINDRQLLGHKGDVHVLSENDTLAHTIVTALELDDWRVQRFRSAEALRLAWQDAMPKVLFIECFPDKMLDCGSKALENGSEKPAIIALMKRVDPELLLHLLEKEVDDYVMLPAEPARLVEACREARLKYNFRDMHREFDSQLIKLKSVSDYLELVIDNSHEAIFTCDLKGNVKLWNKGAERVYGYTAEEIIGKNVDEHLDPPDFARKSSSVIRLLQQRGSMTDPEVMRRRKTGEVFPVSATYTLLRDPSGETLGFSVIERDVTTVKALENERIKSARLRAITQTAVTANDHINTPLGIILGYAQFLELKLSGADPQDKNALEVIQQQVHKIKGIMNKLKLISDPIVKNYSIEGVTMLDLSKSQLSDESNN